MKTAIIYYSKHHANTLKLLEALAKAEGTELIDATKTKTQNLDEYDCIGFASGIYYSKYHQSVMNFAQNNLPQGKAVFFVHTAGDPRENQNKAIKAICEEKNCTILGTYFCKGFDTFGPFKLIGGIAKGHPTQEEISGAVEFFKNIQNR